MAAKELDIGKKLIEKIAAMGDALGAGGTLRAGFLAGATYPNGTPVAMVAAIQDFGAPSRGIPPRPFFRNVVEHGKTTWGEALEKLLKANNYDSKKSLALMGEMIRGEIQNSIANGSYAALAESTIRRKGHAQPLIDTSHMLNSVDYEVID